MHPLLRKLEGGDRRSIGRSADVVAEVLRQPRLFPVLVGGLAAGDPVVRMRAADAMEKITLKRPEYLAKYKARLLRQAGRASQAEVRWHMAQLLPRLPLTPADCRRVNKILESYLRDEGSIVRTFAMQAMADIAMRNPRTIPSLRARLRRLMESGTPAMRARGKKLLKQLEGQ